MRIEIGNSLGEISAVMVALEEFSAGADLEKSVAQAAELVLDELLTNIVSYAYPDAGQHRILVDISLEESALKLVISDDGEAFDPFQREAPDRSLSIEDRKLGGAGVHLVRQFMDECCYRRLDGRNVVTLLKFPESSRPLKPD